MACGVQRGFTTQRGGEQEVTVVDARGDAEEQPHAAIVAQHDVGRVVEKRRTVDGGVAGGYTRQDVGVVSDAV